MSICVPRFPNVWNGKNSIINIYTTSTHYTYLTISNPYYLSHVFFIDFFIYSHTVFLKRFLFTSRERGREGEREREIHPSVASCMPPTGDLASNPGMCPDWESNQWPSGSQASTSSTEPHQPGQHCILIRHFEGSGRCQAILLLACTSVRSLHFLKIRT